MGRGMKSYTPKERREQRRRNHIARDLHSPKYRQRRKENKPTQLPDCDWIVWFDDEIFDEWEKHVTNR
jgi:hypothetical protein